MGSGVGGLTWGFPKIKGTLLGVPVLRIIVFWGLYWGPLILRNYHIAVTQGYIQRCRDYIGLTLLFGVRRGSEALAARGLG